MQIQDIIIYMMKQAALCDEWSVILNGNFGTDQSMRLSFIVMLMSKTDCCSQCIDLSSCAKGYTQLAHV